MRGLAKFPLLDRRGVCTIKKMAPFLSGADGVVDQTPKINKERCATIYWSTTPLASYFGSLPLLARRGNLLTDTLSLQILGRFESFTELRPPRLKQGAGRMPPLRATFIYFSA